MPSQPQYLPTWVSGGWRVAAFKDSLISTLSTDQFCKTLSMYFYAVTQSGWDQVCGPILQWKKRVPERNVLLYVGTDHGITDPDALEQISHEGVNVRLMLKYEGIYHPKLLWLQGEREILCG